MPRKCTGALNFTCKSGGLEVIEKLGACVKCYAHARETRKVYGPNHRTAQDGDWEKQRGRNNNWTLGHLAGQSRDDLDTARLIGKEIYKSLPNKITKDASTPDLELAEVSSMAGHLNQAATELLKATPGSECVAVCLVGVTLIIGTNAARTSDEAALKKVIKSLETNVLGTERISSIILLGAAQPRCLLKGATAWGINAAGLQNPPDTRPHVHAEIRILEFLHQSTTVDVNGVLQSGDPSLAMNPTATEPVGWWGTSKKIYLGVDRPCCAKCYTTITAYNNGNHKGAYKFMFQGYHKMYPFEWRLPQGLRMLRTTIEYNKLKYATA